MQLGLRKNEVQLVAHEAQWQVEFERTKEQLLAHTSLVAAQIEHIGSTAITNIVAKPVIDIAIGVPSLAALDGSFFKELRAAGFYRLQVERPDEIVCARFIDETFEVKTHFLHIVEGQGEKWEALLFFRDYLNAHAEARAAYATLKTTFPGETIEEYTAYKEAFVNEIVAKRKL